MKPYSFIFYLLVMSGVTYLIRMLPMVLIRKRIQNRFLLSFLYYVPYAVLSVMTIPAIFFATDYRISAWVGFVVALFLSYRERSLVQVAGGCCAAAFVTEAVFRYAL